MAAPTPFYFQDFKVEQRHEVFKVGTDGVLAGLLAAPQADDLILEIGTGTGLISLLLANRFDQVKVTAIDYFVEAVNLAKQNFENAPFASRLSVIHADFNQFECNQRYDFIVSNPPFFIPNHQTPDKKRQAARQTTHLSAEQLLAKAPKLLSNNGKMSLIVPELPKTNTMFLHSVILIRSFQASPVIRYFATYGLNPSDIGVVEDELYLYKADKTRSEAYHHLSSNFYIR